LKIKEQEKRLNLNEHDDDDDDDDDNSRIFSTVYAFFTPSSYENKSCRLSTLANMSIFIANLSK